MKEPGNYQYDLTGQTQGNGQEHDLDTLITLLSKLPGFGMRSARRAVLTMVQKRERLLNPLTQAMVRVQENVRLCSACYNVSTQPLCRICQNERRTSTILCVVETVADLWALERTESFKGRYHVLGGVLSALEGVSPDDLRLPQLVARVRANNVTEVVLAMTSSIDGRATGHYIADLLEELNVKVTSLAQGVPIGGELDFLDEGTITAALHARKDLT